MKKYSKALIFLNGDVTDLAFTNKLITKSTFLIGSDGGADHIYSLGLKPHVVVGDFDSIKSVPEKIKNLIPKNKETGEQVEVDGITFLKYPTDKDLTDGELALDFAIQKGFSEINVVCNVSTEIDHVINNVFLLSKDKYAGKDIKIIQSNAEIFVILGNVILCGRSGQKISLMPMFGKVVVESCTGLKYDLAKYNMTMETNAGISNEFITKNAQLKIKSGKFLVVQYKNWGG